MAEFWGIARSTLYKWKAERPKFAEAIRIGANAADRRVEESLYHSAIGYSHLDTDIRVIDGVVTKTEIVKYYPPSTTAQIFWLKNRQRDLWRDRHDVEHTGKDGEALTTESDRDIARRLAFMLEKGDRDPTDTKH